jgi:hypothetical protein
MVRVRDRLIDLIIPAAKACFFTLLLDAIDDRDRRLSDDEATDERNAAVPALLSALVRDAASRCRLRVAPLPFLIDLEVLAAHLNRPDLGHLLPVQFDRKLERAAHE